MGATSIWHWVIVGLIVVLLFGRGKISEVMGDVAKGIKSFKKGMAEDEADEKPSDPKVLDNDQPTTTARSETESRRVG
jgi:sec-independent protein translocase protein TatA